MKLMLMLLRLQRFCERGISSPSQIVNQKLYLELLKRRRENISKRNSDFCPSPFSPDLALCDFFIFPRFKKNVKGKSFDTAEEIKQKSLEGLKDFSMTDWNSGRIILEKCDMINAHNSVKTIRKKL